MPDGFITLKSQTGQRSLPQVHYPSLFSSLTAKYGINGIQKIRIYSKDNVMIEAYSVSDMHSKDYKCGIWIPVIKQDEAGTVSPMTISGIL